MRLESTKVFQEKSVPDGTKLAGWAALTQAFAVDAPVRQPRSVSSKHLSGSHREEGDWTVFDKRYWPGDGFADHLRFALRHEALDLLILKRVFEVVPQAKVKGIGSCGAHGNSRAPRVEFVRNSHRTHP